MQIYNNYIVRVIMINKIEIILKRKEDRIKQNKDNLDNCYQKKEKQNVKIHMKGQQKLIRYFVFEYKNIKIQTFLNNHYNVMLINYFMQQI